MYIYIHRMRERQREREREKEREREREIEREREESCTEVGMLAQGWGPHSLARDQGLFAIDWGSQASPTSRVSEK